jgi:hypothetical protein
MRGGGRRVPVGPGPPVEIVFLIPGRAAAASLQKDDVHETMKRRDGVAKDAVPRLLLETVDRYVMDFLVAYAYLENCIPKDYEGHFFTYLGRARRLHALLLSLGVVYNPSES